jgi:hypothetical protein
MYTKIFNPKTNRKVNIESNLGKQIIKNYLQHAGWLSDSTLRKNLSDKGYYRFGFEFETCMQNGYNCDGYTDNIISSHQGPGTSWTTDSPHELVPTKDSSLRCPANTIEKEFIVDNRSDYLWNGIKSNGYTNIGKYSDHSTTNGYKNINTISNDILRSFYNTTGDLKAQRCLDYQAGPDSQPWLIQGAAIPASSCAFHVHMSDPYIKGTSLEGRVMLIEIATLWRGVVGINETPTFGKQANTFPFMETRQDSKWTVQQVLCNVNYSRDKPPWTSKKIPQMTLSVYKEALEGVLTTPPISGIYSAGNPPYLISALQVLDDKFDGVYHHQNKRGHRYWNLNCGQDTNEPGKSWIDKDDGVHVEFRGHDDPFKVFKNGNFNTKDKQMEYIKDYLRHLIQLFNAAKNRMKLLMYIRTKLTPIKTPTQIVNLYTRFLKSGVVNLEILRQKLYAVPYVNYSLGGDFIHNKLLLKSRDLLKKDWKDRRTNKISIEVNKIDYILKTAYKIKLIGEGISSSNATKRAEVWYDKKIKFFQQGLMYTHKDSLYGWYGGESGSKIPGVKDLFRMFALPNPNTIGPPFIDNTANSNIEIKTIRSINNLLIKEILRMTATHKGLTRTAGKSKERKDWVDGMFSCLKEARIITVYRFIYMFRLEDPNSIGYPFDTLNRTYGKKCKRRLDDSTIKIIKSILNELGISSDVKTEQWY